MSAAGGRLAAAAALAAASSARAAAPPIALEVAPCVPVDAALVARLVALERLDGGATGPGRPIEVRVGCAAELVTVSARAGDAGPAIARAVSLGAAVGSARARALAHVVVELAAAASAAPAAVVATSTPARAAAPPGGRGAPLTGSAGDDRAVTAAPASAALALSVRGFPASGLWLGGAALAGELPVGGRATAGGDLALEGADRGTELGRVRVLALSAAARASLGGSVGAGRAQLGVGVRLGWARLAGHAPAAGVRARTLDELWGGPLVAVSWQGPVAGRLHLLVRVEAGLPLGPVRGLVGTAPQVELEGPWVGLVLGGGVNFRSPREPRGP